MSEPDYRAMLIALCAWVEGSQKIPLPQDIDRWWAAEREPHRDAISDAYYLVQIEEARLEMERNRRKLRAQRQREAKWRDGWEPVDLLAKRRKKSAADEASATAAPQAADPASVVADLEATIPHPIPHESPKEG